MRFFSLVLGVVALNSSAAFAVVDVQLLAGKETVAANDKVSASTTNVGTAAVHVSPLPLAPLALGATATYGAKSLEDPILGKVDYESMTAGPEAMAWLPGLPLTPYVKVSHAVYRHFMATANDLYEKSNQWGASGNPTVVGGGLQWSPVPVVSLLGEYRQTTGEDIVTRTFLFGLAAGI